MKYVRGKEALREGSTYVNYGGRMHCVKCPPMRSNMGKERDCEVPTYEKYLSSEEELCEVPTYEKYRW